MTGAPAPGLWVALVAALALLVWQLIAAGRARKARAAARAGWFEPVRALFSDVREQSQPSGFPRLNGMRHGRLFDLQAVPEALTLRKLPTLWLLVSLPAPIPVGATFDLVRNPTGGETFTNFLRLPMSVSPPEGFPDGAAIRTDDPAQMPDADLLGRHLAIFADARIKELVISPRGLRLVWLAEQAPRGRYLLFRDAEMGHAPLSAQVLATIADALVALADELEVCHGKAAP